jgi:hypothetical protein
LYNAQEMKDFKERLELADKHDLGSCAARRAGSSPASPT